MEPISTIIISCQGATTIELDEMVELQGNLKDLSEENYVKLRNSIVTHGFSFPVFFWQDPADGKKYIIDAHQRKRVLLRMRSEGITIPPLPADPIHAEDKKQAKEKLLLHESGYGKVSAEGLYEFINEPGLEMDMTNLSDMLSIPFLDREEQAEEQAKSESVQKAIHEVTCPACQHTFTPSQ